MTESRLVARGAAARAGMAGGARQWNQYVKRGAAPEPDGHDEVSGTPWWWASTVDAWCAAGRRPAHRPRRNTSPG